MEFKNINPETSAAIASAVAALIAAFYAWRSTRVANRALRIAEDDHRERHSGLAAYLIDGVSWDDQEQGRAVSFSCSLTNAANAPRSIAHAQLHLHAFDLDGTTTEIVLHPTNDAGPDSKPIEIPINLAARTTVSGWLTYRIPNRIVDALTIDRYELTFLASDGERASLNCYLLRRIENATR